MRTLIEFLKWNKECIDKWPLSRRPVCKHQWRADGCVVGKHDPYDFQALCDLCGKIVITDAAGLQQYPNEGRYSDRCRYQVKHGLPEAKEE